MKLSIVVATPEARFSALALKGDFRDNFALLNSLGYDGVELAVRDPQTIHPEKISSLLEEFHLQLSAIGTGRAFGEDGLSFTSSEQSVRNAAVERVKRHIDLAHELKSKVILGLILGKTEMNKETEHLALECVQTCSEYAAKQNVSLLIEPINRYETSFINTVDQCLEFIQKIGRPSCRILVDTFHMNIEEPSIYKSIKKAESLIGHVHIADSNRWHPG
ncbi:MAG: sugar phosphate isomerase/epimerase family protein, partial [bacterium]